jgi:hypothetical protein
MTDDGERMTLRELANIAIERLEIDCERRAIARLRAAIALANEQVAAAAFRDAERDCLAAAQVVCWMWYLAS